MSKPENMMTTAEAAGVTHDPQPVEAEAPAATLTPAQEQALDRDGDGKAGGAPKGGNKKRQAGDVIAKGKAPPTPEELGDNPKQLVVCRVTDKGDNRIHNGRGGRFDAGDQVVLELAAAQALKGNPSDKKARGYVDILGRA